MNMKNLGKDPPSHPWWMRILLVQCGISIPTMMFLFLVKVGWSPTHPLSIVLYCCGFLMLVTGTLWIVFGGKGNIPEKEERI